MGLRLFFLPNFPGATLIQGGTFIPASRVNQNYQKISAIKVVLLVSKDNWSNFKIYLDAQPEIRIFNLSRKDLRR